MPNNYLEFLPRPKEEGGGQSTPVPSSLDSSSYQIPPCFKGEGIKSLASFPAVIPLKSGCYKKDGKKCWTVNLQCSAQLWSMSRGKLFNEKSDISCATDFKPDNTEEEDRDAVL